MLPILFKIDFNTPATQVLLAVLAVAVTLYLAWSGWQGAADRAEAPWRAAPFGAAGALLACVGVVYAAPPLSSSLASLVRGVVWFFSAVLVVSGALYGKAIAKKGEEAQAMALGATVGGVCGYLAINYGLGGVLGRNTGLPVHTYGLMIATAFLVAITLAAREAARAYPELLRVDGKSVPAGPVMRDHMLELAFWIFAAAIVGSRLLFVITKWDDYKGNPWQALSPTGGGLVFYGGFIGAALASVYYARKHQIEFLRLADVAIPSVAIGHTIGRFGCFSAGCCWGGIAKAGSRIAVSFPSAHNLPFGGYGADSLAFADQAHDGRYVDGAGHLFSNAVAGAQRISDYANAHGHTLPVYPTQLMESGGELLLFVLLLVLRRHKRFNGQILATWLVGYAILRFSVEFFRGDVIRNFLFKWPNDFDPVILSTSQTISLGIFLTGAAIFVLYGRRPKAALAPAAPAA
jgi:phosphatidylglycerol:prolipoprotein diacylglycerol transferase